MRRSPRIVTLVAALVTSAVLAGPLAAAGPELVSAKPFDVQVANGQVNMTFTLTLSEVNNYPVKISALCCTTEEVLYEGALSEGVYRFSAPLKKISGHGDLTVVLRTQVTNRKERGNESYAVYLKWQGPM